MSRSKEKLCDDFEERWYKRATGICHTKKRRQVKEQNPRKQNEQDSTHTQHSIHGIKTQYFRAQYFGSPGPKSEPTNCNLLQQRWLCHGPEALGCSQTPPRQLTKQHSSSTAWRSAETCSRNSSGIFPDFICWATLPTLLYLGLEQTKSRVADSVNTG